MCIKMRLIIGLSFFVLRAPYSFAQVIENTEVEESAVAEEDAVAEERASAVENCQWQNSPSLKKSSVG